MEYAVGGLIGAVFGAMVTFIWARKGGDDSVRLQAELDAAQDLREQIEATRNDYIVKYEAEQQARIELERSVSARNQEISSLREQMNDLELMKKQHMEAAKASLAEVGNQLSNKLLTDHKREGEEKKKEYEAKAQQLNKQFQDVFSSMQTLSKQVESVEVVREALLNPSGVGQLGEITLENLLRNSGLKEDIDYKTQFSFAGDGGSLKPDAAVFIPGDAVLLIDSKSSKHFIDRAQAGDDVEAQKVADQQIKERMRKHLKDLTSRDYKRAFEQNDTTANGHVSLIMFLPSDAAWETVTRIDPKFLEDAMKERVQPMGPSGLVNLLFQSHMVITNAKQHDNIVHIQNEVQKLVNNIGTLYGHADGIGKNLEQALKKYNAFSGSFNSSLQATVKRLGAYGIAPPANKPIQRLKKYDFVHHDIDAIALEDEPEMPDSRLLEAENA